MTDTTPAADLVAALSELAEPVKDARANAGNRSWTYMTLTGLLEAVRPVLGRHGIAVMQEVERTDTGVKVTTVLLHRTGERWTSPAFDMPAGRDPHALASATTYARRLSMSTMVGLAGADDDDAITAQAQHQHQRPRGHGDNQSHPVGDPVQHATADQLEHLGHLLHELDAHRPEPLTPDERRQLVAAAINRPTLTSAADLTVDEAAHVIHQLQAAVADSEANAEPEANTP